VVKVYGVAWGYDANIVERVLRYRLAPARVECTFTHADSFGKRSEKPGMLRCEVTGLTRDPAALEDYLYTFLHGRHIAVDVR